MTLRYLEALRHKAETLDSLDQLVEIIQEKVDRAGIDMCVHSKGTWSRLLSGKQEPGYPHLVEIALLCDLPLPDVPPLVAAREVVEWHQIGKQPPRFGILMSAPGKVEIATDDQADSVVVDVVRARTASVRRVRARTKGIILIEQIKPVDERLLGRGKSGNPVTIRAAAQRAAAELDP